MKMIIDISEEEYKEVLGDTYSGTPFENKIFTIIANGTPYEEKPPITQGHWRSVGFEKGYAFCICPKCGKTIRLVRDNKNEFCCIADIREKAIACLYCGARMES